MMIQQLTYAEVKLLKDQQKKTNTPVTNDGYPIFNTCTHTFLDLSHPEEDSTTENNMHTLCVHLPNGDYVTFCNIPYRHTNNSDGCVDISYYGPRGTEIIGLNLGGADQRVKGNLYTMTYTK
ncbi:hypothetical protein [Alicyclobacillus ferrooxydans]|uniref:Uncharacterized protein n=1 Tax=Alicyclobacillus ferrooxydans TaxID=471514 RepID=A0A0P9CB49_9BACL|nr:hypothetical protein [Alicyclobacillus ferrooxydans]KPV42698.1 hypothetical protein AN477_16345 [Alicyclobacillus ferrooxydans]